MIFTRLICIVCKRLTPHYGVGPMDMKCIHSHPAPQDICRACNEPIMQEAGRYSVGAPYCIECYESGRWLEAEPRYA